MKKEIIFAIVLGLSLGLIVTYGTYRARKSFSGASTTAEETNNGQVTGTPEPGSELISLLSPEDESITATKEVKVTGTTTPNSLVTIYVHNKPYIIQADASGNFSVQGTLETGANIIVVSAIDEDGHVAEVERTVIYSTVPLEAPVASAAASPSPKPKATVRPTVKPTVTPTP